MENMEVMLRNLKLSAAEKKGLKIRTMGKTMAIGGGVVQALGKVL